MIFWNVTGEPSFDSQLPGNVSVFAGSDGSQARQCASVGRFRRSDFFRSSLSAPSYWGSRWSDVAPMGWAKTVLEIVQQTQQVVGTNTNLGMALLLTPLYLAAVKMAR